MAKLTRAEIQAAYAALVRKGLGNTKEAKRLRSILQETAGKCADAPSLSPWTVNHIYNYRF